MRSGGLSSGWGALAVLLVADMIYGFQQTAITPALPVVQHDLGASREWTVWLFSGYLIVASVAPVFLGKLADRAGKVRVYLAALAVFLVGSIGAAVSPSIQLVVLCRLVQGVGGVVFPLSFAIVTELLPRNKVGKGIGILTGGFGLGSLIGFPLGGLITELLSWRWIFGVGAVALAMAIGLVRFTVPTFAERVPRRLDTPGALLFGSTMAALILALTEGPQRGWTSPFTLIMFAIAVAAAIGWYFREMSTAEPLMDLRVLASRRVLFTNITSLLSGYAGFGVNLLLPFLLVGMAKGTIFAAAGLGAGPLLTGLALLPRALGQAVGAPLTGPLARAFGPGRAFAGGMVLVTAAAAGLAFWRSHLWMILIELAALGVGFGLAISLSGTIVALAARPGETAIATSITSVLRRAGGGVGGQISIAILAAIALPNGNPAPEAFTIAFATSAGAGIIGAAAALFAVPREPQRQA